MVPHFPPCSARVAIALFRLTKMARSPARLFASLVPATGEVYGEEKQLEQQRGVKAGCSRCAARGRQVEVTGSAELCAPPDRAALTVSVSNSKESAKDAANSVQRRLEYILHSARQHGVTVRRLPQSSYPHYSTV